MGRYRRGLFFWALLAISVVLNTVGNAQTTTTKKEVWGAKIFANGEPVGAAQIWRIITTTHNPDGTKVTEVTVNYLVRTKAYACASSPCAPGEILVTKASFAGPGVTTPWVRVLCDGNCTYWDDGNLSIEGTLAPPLPGGFFFNLNGGTLQVLLNDGALGVGFFEKII